MCHKSPRYDSDVHRQKELGGGTMYHIYDAMVKDFLNTLNGDNGCNTDKECKWPSLLIYQYLEVLTCSWENSSVLHRQRQWIYLFVLLFQIVTSIELYPLCIFSDPKIKYLTPKCTPSQGLSEILGLSPGMLRVKHRTWNGTWKGMTDCPVWWGSLYPYAAKVLVYRCYQASCMWCQ